jgi:indolepyruvate ferredoxin oxidoreductase alpha subunit
MLDVVYNKGRSVLVVLDNRTTAMTGHQDHPGTGHADGRDHDRGLDRGGRARVRDAARRDGKPLDLSQTERAVAEALASETTSMIVTRAPCPLRERKAVGPARAIDQSKCKACQACVRLGCPAIEAPERGKPPRISEELCAGCGLCDQVCKFGAIAEREASV